ncbi:hypothetical protein [Actinomadura sp. 21ATH]|uniref:hypothetical protein n=1 Tax=Actinomadura sp. 21ATH TaxID=1735444 RepID=UPI0035C23A15
MALPPLRVVPAIPGWITRRDHVAGELVATRITNLTPYQVEHGCKSEIRAVDQQELVWLCTGQSVLAELVVTASLERQGRAVPAEDEAP